MIHTNSKYKLLTSLLLTILFISCSKEENLLPTPVQNEFTLRTRASDISDNNYQVMNYLNIYMFNQNKLYEEKLAIESKTANQLKTTISPGTWNMVAISCIDHNIDDKLELPVNNQGMNQLMWKMKKNLETGFMEEMPELLYGIIPDVEVTTPTTEKEVDLIRNVARVDVILEHKGFDSDLFNQYPDLCYFELNKVPTSLSWEGKLLPERDEPYISDRPLRQNIQFDQNGKADTIRFIVPAHRGEDFYAPMASIEDYSRHKVFIQACLPNPDDVGAGYFAETIESEGIEIPLHLKMNRIIEVKFRFYGPGIESLLDVSVSAKEWEKTDVNKEF